MHPSIPHKFRQSITHERLRQLLRYDPATGEFFWLVARNSHARRVQPGDKVIGTFDRDGYQIIGLDGHRYQASRLAWFYVHGMWPNGEVDHQNRVVSDNRINNLRLADERLLQRANQKVRSDSRSGYKGVGWHAKNGKWRARLRKKTIGYFNTPEEAHAAYVIAAQRAFGAFARAS